MSDTPPESQPQGTLQTKLARKWVIKITVGLVVLFGFGIYGLYDALVAYPNRGEKSAEWHLNQYLDLADKALMLEDDLTVPEGTTAREQYKDIESRLGDLTRSSEGASLRAKADLAEIARYKWMESLSVLGRLSNERIASDLGDKPRDTYNELQEKWKSSDQPKPLASYDIPVQWAFVVVGFGGGLIMLLHAMRVVSKKYTWNPDELRLGLPGGASLVPSDIEVFDKRKWDKFLIFLKVKPEHSQLGGQEIKLDLYQYEPLESWYEQMHKNARPEDFDDEEEEFAAADEESQPGESQEEEQPRQEG